MDADGAPTAIGINQNVVVASELPTQTKRGVLAHFSFPAGAQSSEKQMTVTFSAISPAGKVITANTADAKTSPAKWDHIPQGFNLSAEFGLEIREYGNYCLKISVQSPDGEEIESGVDLYVVNPDKQ